jgi:hypothetical protein
MRASLASLNRRHASFALSSALSARSCSNDNCEFKRETSARRSRTADSASARSCITSRLEGGWELVREIGFEVFEVVEWCDWERVRGGTGSGGVFDLSPLISLEPARGVLGGWLMGRIGLGRGCEEACLLCQGSRHGSTTYDNFLSLHRKYSSLHYISNFIY